MNQNLIDLCHWVVDSAKKLGATDCKVQISKRRFVEINYLDKKPETIKEATTQSLSIDIFMGQKFSSQSTPDLRKTAIEDFLKKSIDNAKYVEDDPYRKLPDEGYFKPEMTKDLNIVDKTYVDYTPEKRHEIATAIEASCLKEGGDKVVSVEAGCYDDHYEEIVVNSKGFVGTTEATQFWAGAQMTAQDEGDRRPTGYYWVGARMASDLPDLNKVGVQAAQKTLELLGGQKIKTEKLPIIILNRNVGRVLGGLLEAMNGRNIQQESSFLIGKKGQKIGSELFSLIDDPFKEKGMGSRLYDGDGLMTRRLEPIKNGVLTDYYIDWYYSQKLNMPYTMGGTSNLSIPEGEKSIAELMTEFKRGIIINGFIGGNSNSTTGDFSMGIIGHLFENGELVQPIAEMNIADNHLEFWNKLVAVGNDSWPYGSWNMPSLVFDNIVVSGI
jgi:PmbA protein